MCILTFSIMSHLPSKVYLNNKKLFSLNTMSKNFEFVSAINICNEKYLTFGYGFSANMMYTGNKSLIQIYLK